MKKFSDFRPTNLDSHIPVEGKEEWYQVEGIVLHPKLDELVNESNFHSLCDMLAKVGEKGEDWDTLLFGHWATDFEIIVVKPNTEAYNVAERAEKKVDECVLLNEDDHSNREWEAAQYVWKHCYSQAARIAYIRKNYRDFEFRSLQSVMECVRGKAFYGSVGELVH